MIRNGIILADIADKNKIEVKNEDLQQEIFKKASSMPGQEQAVIKYFQENRNAIDSLRGEVLEEKTIDFILEKGNFSVKKTSIKDLEKLLQDE